MVQPKKDFYFVMFAWNLMMNTVSQKHVSCCKRNTILQYICRRVWRCFELSDVYKTKFDIILENYCLTHQLTLIFWAPIRVETYKTWLKIRCAASSNIIQGRMVYRIIRDYLILLKKFYKVLSCLRHFDVSWRVFSLTAKSC